ncbi:hypothetical protein EVC24_158 [Rhizobium phage RHph_I4]|nr:hypothetical protein EVC24_158 [Rhizobium phage RHph_I4]
MGTRHVIAVQQDGIYKIGQYGQWDGYPSGQGIDILRFLRSLRNDDLVEFRRKVASAIRITNEERNRILDQDGGNSFSVANASLSRDTGAKILTMLMESSGPLRVYSDISFIGNSLFCEWAYVIDLDRNTFEVFEGFNKTETGAHSRFPSGSPLVADDRADGYHPCRLLKVYKLDALPTDEDFLKLGDEEQRVGMVEEDDTLPQVETPDKTKATARAVRI